MKKESEDREVLESYNIEADEINVKVNITGGKYTICKYELCVPQRSEPTKALLDEIRHLLVAEVAMSGSEVMDPKVVKRLKTEFKQKAIKTLNEKLPGLKEETKNFLIGTLLQELTGLGKVEFLLNDGNLEEIVINSAQEPVRVYHKKYGWLETNVTVETESQIHNYANIIARRVGRQITTLNPLLDAHLVTGDRANAVLSPISNKGNTITIRKFARDPWTVTDFIKNKTSTPEIFSLLWLAYQYEMNVLVSGGTGSGKTNFLNVCMPFIPPNHRLISIEDTRELQLPKYLYWCPMTTRLPNPEGKGEISMLDLLITSLRMRPDRIILGEIRKKDQAEVLFEAMHTGHSVYATVHANTVQETIQRLVNPPISVPANLLEAVNLNVVMFRDRRRGLRRTYQVGEFILEEGEKTAINPNILYRWKATDDTIVPHSNSLRFFEELNRHAGLEMKEITKDLATKQSILKWLVKKDVRDIERVGRIMNEYYINQERLIKAVNQNSDPKNILGKNV